MRRFNHELTKVGDPTPKEIHTAILVLNQEIERLEEQLDALQREVAENESGQYPSLVFEQVVDQVVDRVLDQIGEDDGEEAED